MGRESLAGRNDLCILCSGLLLWVMSVAVLWLAVAIAPLRAQAACANPYIVQPGDGWYKIVNKCGIGYPLLIEANRALWERQGETLYVGDRLQMPTTPLPTRPPIYTPIPTPLPTLATTPVSTVQNPRETVRLFWMAVITGIRTGDFRTAYGYFDPQLQSALPYPTFVAGFAATKELTIGSIVTVQENATQATVEAIIIAAEQSGTGWDYHRRRYRNALVLYNGQWRITVMENLGDDAANSCANTIPTRLQRGMRAIVLPQPPTPNRVFREPSRQSPLLGRIYPGEMMTLLDGPRCAQQSVWWYVQADNGVIGWTAEGQPGEYWLAPAGSTPPPPDPSIVGPITFCTTIDQAKRCLNPTNQFPIGLKRLEVNWSFQNLPSHSPITHVWYHNSAPFFQRSSVVWEANRSSTAGFGYTFYAPLGGLPTGQWRLEFRRQRDNQLLQSATFWVGPAR